MFLMHTLYTLYRICCRNSGCRASKSFSLEFNRYQDFFELFVNFKGYTEFFLLQDIVSDDFLKIKFFLPFDKSFPTQPLPKNLDDYLLYIKNTNNFVVNRGKRMLNQSKI